MWTAPAAREAGRGDQSAVGNSPSDQTDLQHQTNMPRKQKRMRYGGAIISGAGKQSVASVLPRALAPAARTIAQRQHRHIKRGSIRMPSKGYAGIQWQRSSVTPTNAVLCSFVYQSSRLLTQVSRISNQLHDPPETDAMCYRN